LSHFVLAWSATGQSVPQRSGTYLLDENSPAFTLSKMSPHVYQLINTTVL
jgi:hypothetical protein